MSVFAAATGIGSWPGTSPRQAAEIVVGELHTLPHLVELPARGVGADMIGRAGALLVDIGIDTVPRGYRIAPGRSAVVRRAVSLLDEDLDALEEAWENAGLRGGTRTVKVQSPGPITLAAQLELPGGHRAITDAGAVRDLAASLAEGMAQHRAEVARRLDTTVVVQFDEPLLPAALEGRLTGVTSFTPVHPVDEPVAIGLIDDCVAAVGAEVVVAQLRGRSAMEDVAAQHYSCRIGRRVHACRCRSRRHRRVRRKRSHGAARGRPVDRTRCTPVVRGGREGGGRHHRPARIRAVGTCVSGSASPRPAGWREPPRNGLVSPSNWRRRRPTRFAEDPDAI